MSRIRVFICLFILLFSQKLLAQVDTVTFRFEPDYATFKIKCIAQKVNVVSGDSTFTDFQITDTVNGAYTFDWSGSEVPKDNVDYLPSAWFKFNAGGSYVFDLAVFEDASGKTYTDSKTFEVLDIIIVPNVFTPNNDGVNDLFIIRANGDDPLEISIYSRTGTLVYNTTSPIIVWDGRNSSGSIVSEGIYFYILKSEDPTVPVQKGFFHLYNKELK